MTEEEVRATYGFSPDDPILCNFIEGERQFIASLRCPNGHRLKGPRRGSAFGTCTKPESHTGLDTLLRHYPADAARGEQTYMVDIYELACEAGEYRCTLYFDMYHPNISRQPPPRGLTRV